MAIRFRDYQTVVIRDVFSAFGIKPAGPPDDPIVIACGGSYGARKNSFDVGDSTPLADRQGDDDKPQVRTQYASDPDF